MFISKSFPKSLLKNLSPTTPYRIPYQSYVELFFLLQRYFPSEAFPHYFEPPKFFPTIPIPNSSYLLNKLQTKLSTFFEASKQDIDYKFLEETNEFQNKKPASRLLQQYLGENSDIIIECALMEEENCYLAMDLLSGFHKMRRKDKEESASLGKIFQNVLDKEEFSQVAFFKNFLFANSVNLLSKSDLDEIWTRIKGLKERKFKASQKLTKLQVRELLYLLKIEILIDDLLFGQEHLKNHLNFLLNQGIESEILLELTLESDIYPLRNENENKLLIYQYDEGFLKMLESHYKKLNYRDKIRMISFLGNKNSYLDIMFLNDFDEIIETADFQEVCQIAHLFPIDNNLIDFLIGQTLGEENINDLIK